MSHIADFTHEVNLMSFKFFSIKTLFLCLQLLVVLHESLQRYPLMMPALPPILRLSLLTSPMIRLLILTFEVHNFHLCKLLPMIRLLFLRLRVRRLLLFCRLLVYVHHHTLGQAFLSLLKFELKVSCPS